MDVFIVGAGFSRAISRHMPLVSDLGEAVVRELAPDEQSTFRNFNLSEVEAWLSYLSSDAPWLNEAGRLRNRSVFLRASYIIGFAVASAELAARSAPPPEWLLPLVARWHEDRSTVISLNYDTLVEAAYTDVVEVRSTPDNDRYNYVSAVQIRRAPLTPIHMRIGGTLGASECETFRLIKLHGSVDWLYSGRESFYGEPIYDAHHGQGWGGFSRYRNDLTEDKVPLIVPPTSGKSTFFNNEILRGQWSDARARLRNASRVFVVGYSIPQTDELITNLLRDAVSPEADVIAVDPQSSVAERLDRLLPQTIVRDFVGPECVAALARSLPPTTTRPVHVSRP